MASLVTEQGMVHYEVYGRGRPVLLLHGWLNSWNVWRGAFEALGDDFRLYALDFFGFGDSGEGAQNYTVDTFSRLVEQFMERMGIARAPVIGHSMGGTVALMTALRLPEQVVKVGVVGSPINGASLSMLLRIAAFQPWQTVAKSNPALFTPVQVGLSLFLRGYSRVLAKDARAVGKMLTSDLNKLTVMPFLESIGTLRQTDLRTKLDGLTQPVLGVYGAKDVLVDPKEAQVLKAAHPAANVAWFQDSGHFPMMDEPPRFYETMRGFLAGVDSDAAIYHRG